jgi:glyoxylase I family protein
VATYRDVYKLTYVRGPSGIIVMLAEELNRADRDSDTRGEALR